MSGLGATASDLLRRLSSAAGGGLQAVGGAVTGVGASAGADFAALLDKASAGEFSSGLALKVEGAALSEGQVSRLERVADAAEAAGATKVLALIDGQSLTIDLTHRVVSPAKPSGAQGIVTGVDAVAIVPGEGQGEASIVRPGEGLGIGGASDNARLRELLAARDGGASAA